MQPDEIITDAQLERVHRNADFGDMTMREVVNQGVLKAALGYYQGSTSKRICEEHGLIDKNYKLTKKGKEYLCVVFRSKISV